MSLLYAHLTVEHNENAVDFLNEMPTLKLVGKPMSAWNKAVRSREKRRLTPVLCNIQVLFDVIHMFRS